MRVCSRSPSPTNAESHFCLHVWSAIAFLYEVQAPAGAPGAEEQGVVAVARELAGFVWAIGCQVQSSGWQGIKTESAATVTH